MPWGHHQILDCSNCNIGTITNKENIEKFVKELVDAIGMTAYGDPQIVYFADHDPDKSGYTLIQLIETSNICAHFVDNRKEAYIDIFSCKDFDEQTVIDTVYKYFLPQNIKSRKIERSAKTG